ncbi:MAG: dihydrofolate reductase family protein [Acidobacteriota bacterium]
MCFLALSADGYIARADGDVAWLDRPGTAGDYGMAEFYASVDTVLLGRKTWELGKKLGQTSFPGKKNFVFSRTIEPSPESEGEREGEVEVVREDPGEFASRLKKTKGESIWMVGGAGLIASFLDAGQIDELILHVIPILLGEGIPLVEPRRRDVPLDLVSSRGFADGSVQLHYAVRPARAAEAVPRVPADRVRPRARKR